MKVFLGKYQAIIDNTIEGLNKNKIIHRIWQKDHTVWGDKPAEISNRLGWLDCIETTKKSFDEINSFVRELKGEGFTDALLMGMGGSSLAPEVFRKTFGVKSGFPDLHVLDSTHPEAVLDYKIKLDPSRTIYIVSTKSGGTIETISFMKYFFSGAVKKLGKEKASQNFIAITDPGSGLEATARGLKFGKIFLNDPDIGGRFSALSLFGIVPAALIGIDIDKLFLNTERILEDSKNTDLQKNDSALLGAIIGTFANEGVDKLTIISSPKIQHFSAWLEQLIAESTGKDKKGILPVNQEIVSIPEHYSKDRLFVYLKLKNDSTFDKKIEALRIAGFPVIELEMNNIFDLGAEYFRWEFATAVAGYVMGVQPFDQPNVESAKVAARNMMKKYSDSGKLPLLKTVLAEDGIKVFGEVKSKKIEEVFNEFLSATVKGVSYVALQAYLKPGEKTWKALQVLRLKIFSRYRVATTLGYGPRFLHSTGQLHKGDGGNGFFIQFISDYPNDAPIPDEAGEERSLISFGTLIKAQALGDRQALIENNRKVIRFQLSENIVDGINTLANLI